MHTRAAIVMVIVLCLCSSVYAEQDLVVQPSAVEEPVAAETVVVEPAPAPAAAEIAKEPIAVEPEIVMDNGLVSLDFRDADIQDVLRVLSFKSGVNIVTGPEVVGLVTIKLTDVPWQRALDVVLQTYGYAYDRKGNIITVTTIENLKKRREDAMLLAEQERLETKTFFLNYAKASQIITSIEKMCTTRGSVNFDERTNALIVQDIPSNLELIEEVVTRLDETTPQVLIEAKIVETTLTDAEELGFDWTVQVSANGSSRTTTFPFAARSDNKYLNPPFPTDDDYLKGVFQYGTIDSTSLGLVFEMLKTRSNTDILSNPRIVTLDNKPARIVVGSQYPIPVYTYNEDQAKLQVSGWEYKDIGIIFEVTPHVNNAGLVTLDLKPKVTAILETVTVENTDLPRLSIEEAVTSVMVKDGETLVIAGLVKDQVTETKKKVPILGSIPLLGKLFQKDEGGVTKTDLLIFITPHIITPENETTVVSSQAKP